MQNKTIKIPAVEYSKVDINEEILSSLIDIANNYRYTLNDPNSHLDSLIKEYKNNINNGLKELKSRIDTWKGLLGKYYKMTSLIESGSHTYRDIRYIYPYKVIDANNTLWLLEIRIGDDYSGGVVDKSYTIDENWNRDIYLDEVTEEEFRNKAFDATKHVINMRLDKLSNIKENELDN